MHRPGAERAGIARASAVARPQPRDVRPGLVHPASAVVLATALVSACAIAAFALVTDAVGHSETLEAVWWMCAIGVVAPLSAFGANYLLRASAPPALRRRLPATAAAALVVLSASLALARAAGALPLSLLAVLVLPILLLAAQRSRLRELPAAVQTSRAGAIAVGVAGLLGIAAFLPRASREPAVLVSTVLLLAWMGAVGVPLSRVTPGRRLRIALAVAIPLLLALFAWDVSFQTLPNHQNFYLGPVNDIDHGRYMLVDDYSQYGVAVIYFLAAVLSPLTLGYGSLVLVLGLLTVVMFAAVYTVIRVATRSAVFAGLGTFAALTASVIATQGRTTQVPSTGFLRFGLPWLIVCALVVAYRRDRPSRLPLLIAWALVGTACIWSFESAFYSVVTFAATAIAVASTGPPGTRLRCACAHLGAAAVAVITAVSALVAATEIGRGELPQPGGYVDFLRLYSVKGFGTLPIPGWSLGYLMCALYALSLCGIAVLIRQARGTALARPAAIVPLIAVTAFGASAFTYFLGRSHPNNLTHVAPPFVAMVVLWTALAWRAWARGRHPAAAAALGLCAVAGALLVAQQLPSLIGKTDDSALMALARSATGGRTLPHELRVLTSEPVADPHARTVELLVRRSVPPTAPLLVATEPTIATEALIRLQRSDVLPIGAAEQDMLVEPRRELLTREARNVPCGTYVVTQAAPLVLGDGLRFFDGILGALRERHAFHAVAAADGYRVSRLSCPAA